MRKGDGVTKVTLNLGTFPSDSLREVSWNLRNSVTFVTETEQRTEGGKSGC